jgi:outer membrane receptor protein involved in Fe transport
MTQSGRKLQRVVLAAAALGIGSTASADGVERLDAVDVVGHYENAVGTSDAASQGRITRQLIEDRPILRPGEVLELVPGLIITQHSGAGKANQYYLRGFNLDHGTDFLTTVGGMPVNLRTHAHGQGYTDLNFLIPELIDHVDYLKGPYFASKGDFASAGAADIHYVESLSRSLVEVSAGSFRYGRGLLVGAPAVGPGRLVYGLEVYHNDGPWERDDDFRKVNAVLRWVQNAGDAQWSVTAMGYRGKWNATDQIPQRAVAAGLIGRFGTLDPTTGGESHRYSLSADWASTLAGGQLQLNAYAIKYGLDLYSNFTYRLDHPDEGDQFLQADDRWLYGGSGSLTWLGKLGGHDTRNVVGFEARQDRIRPVGLYSTAARERLSTTREDRVRESSVAVYVENEIAWHPQFRTIAGLRADAFRFAVDSDNPANSGDASDSRVSPKLSAIIGPWAKTEFFVNFGNGFHSNDARGVTTTVDPKSGEPVDRVTPLVRTRGGELGVRSEWLPQVQSSLALWRLDIDSELLFVGDAGTTEASRPSRRQGVEWNTRWRPKPWLLFDLDVAWSKARFTDGDAAGSRIPGAIESAVSAGATLRDLGPWSASVFMRYFGQRPLIEDNSVRSSSSTIFNAQVGYRFDPRTRVALEIYNLFDRRADDIAYYYTSRLAGEPAEGVADIHFHPAESRSVRATLSYAF